MQSRKPFRRGEVPNWEYVRLDAGKFRNFFLAGPVFGVATHYYPRTRACRKDITDGEVECFCDKEELETRWRGYVPLWDEQGVRWCVVIGERFGPQAMRIEHLAPVRVSKMTGRGTPIRVDQVNWSSTPPRLDARDEGPQDIRRWLIKIWGDKLLLDWWKSKKFDQTRPLPAKKRTKLDTGFAKRVDDIEQVIVPPRVAPGAKVPASLEEVMAEIGKNGTHKKK